MFRPEIVPYGWLAMRLGQPHSEPFVPFLGRQECLPYCGTPIQESGLPAFAAYFLIAGLALPFGGSCMSGLTKR